MFSMFKMMRLGAALKDRRHVEEAFSAVVALGRIGNAKAVDLLIGALSRKDNVARSAARELGRIGDERAAGPLAELLGHPEVSQSAADALAKLGGRGVEMLMATLKHESVDARLLAAGRLGDLGDSRAVEALIETLTHDGDYGVRTAAATALGGLKDKRAVWVLVGTLKLRGETSPERQQALNDLQQAARLALNRIGELLTASSGSGGSGSIEAWVEQLEQEVVDSPMHPRLLSEIHRLTEAELVAVLKDLVSASEEISWAKLENRQPMLAAHFQSYEQRQRTAEAAGRELLRRGGRPLLDLVLSRDLGSYASLVNWWADLAP
jgi:HEAT repeat protein